MLAAEDGLMKPGKSLESSVGVLAEPAPFEVFAACREAALLEVLAAGRY